MGDTLAGTQRPARAAGTLHQKRAQAARFSATNSQPKTRTSTKMTETEADRIPDPKPTASTLSSCRMLASVLVAGLLIVACAGRPAAAVGSKQQPDADTKAALEAELNSILQRHELAQDPSGRLLSEAIISRLMLGNASGVEALEALEEAGASGLEGPQQLQATSESVSREADETAAGAEALHLRRILAYLQNYDVTPGGRVFDQYPVLPAGQAATIKRASLKMGNYLRQQQQHAGQRQLNGYGRVNSFDFGLGKRPDASVSSNILRFGDSASAGGHMAAVSGSGLGKRPSAHRYDFGLGKRVASPAYPRYDFGLGKRAPNRIRYDFGLGK